VADDVSTGEIVRRLDRLEVLLQDLSMRLVSADVYNRDQRETERRFAELERELAEEKQARKEDIKTLADRMDKGGSNVRQAIYAGLIPSVLFLVGILLQLKGN
jgi:hypothetical protein